MSAHKSCNMKLIIVINMRTLALNVRRHKHRHIHIAERINTLSHKCKHTHARARTVAWEMPQQQQQQQHHRNHTNNTMTIVGKCLRTRASMCVSVYMFTCTYTGDGRIGIENRVKSASTLQSTKPYRSRVIFFACVRVCVCALL